MELWSKEHAQTLLPAIGVMLVVAVILRLTIGKKSLKVRMIPFQILAVILFALEIGKQIVSYQKGYDLYHLPFHFCSLFIFMLPLMAFYRGKHQQTVFQITMAICGATTLLTVVYPCLIYSADNIKEFFTVYLSMHTVAFHNIVIFEFILIVALGLVEPAHKGGIKSVAIFTVCFCVVSASLAHILKTNFNNFYVCNIAPLETVRLAVQNAVGTVVAQLMYVLIVTVLDILVVQFAYWLGKRLLKLLKREEEPQLLS
ncbi:MAG: hypothetical protein E7439_07310 [Ruminococcaceae bacterium]|nr:hypothetical protein [Oscillospiraceae bacterium]